MKDIITFTKNNLRWTLTTTLVATASLFIIEQWGNPITSIHMSLIHCVIFFLVEFILVSLEIRHFKQKHKKK